jgi:magnesium-protoporphyrin O-methyltransferase
MDSCQCQGLEQETEKWALEDLALFREGRPVKTTTMLIDALLDAGVDGFTLLDIGGGVGAVQLRLLAAGVTAATSVEASTAYLQVARREAEQAGQDRKISYVHGDFTVLAKDLPQNDIVTLDRVLCCYHDVRSLVSLSADKARRLYGLVYPRSAWWTRVALFFENLVYRVRRSPFRAYVHSSELVERLIQEGGLREISRQTTMAWQVVVYQRAAAQESDLPKPQGRADSTQSVR